MCESHSEGICEPVPVALQLWAKTDRSCRPFGYKPLMDHMLDAAAIADLIWKKHLTPALRNRLENCLGVDNAHGLFMFLCGAHDIGKASPGFQKKSPPLCKFVNLPFSERDRDCPHGIVSAFVLGEILGHSPQARLFGQIVGAHHGTFPRSSELRLGRDALGADPWNRARTGILKEFADLIGVELNETTLAAVRSSDPLVVPVLAGLASVVDWIASNQDFFPCVSEAPKPIRQGGSQYWEGAKVRAEKALEQLGWLPAVVFSKETSFEHIFRAFSPNALQVIVARVALGETSPFLMIVEAPTGSGKTEAAIYAADLAMCRGFARGMYIAMPTQATSTAMFGRVLDGYLRNRGHQGRLNLQLVHGDAVLARSNLVAEGEIADFSPESLSAEGDEDGDIEAHSWFTAKKRPLLSPFGVGTVDQSLLCVLQTRHWFVRSFGLAGKVVIFDEVHAYDAYMGAIFERLLHWLAELDCTVIILSATLPEARRKALARAYSGREDAETTRYPRLTLAQPRRYPDSEAGCPPLCLAVPMERTHEVSIEFASTHLNPLAATLNRSLEGGGCAAVVCNTVDRAIEVFKHMRDHLSETECLLFHARTLRMWRRQIEQDVLRKFGKRQGGERVKSFNPYRPARAVLVATQVIEQSLDLDFDLMVSEIAPIDLILQRAGRLHRHLRQRPPGLESPRLIVLCDAETSGPPPTSFGKGTESVYDRYVLLRTWRLLRERGKIDVPSEVEPLVEAVYGSSPTPADERWDKALKVAKDKMEFSRRESEEAARKMLVCGPRNPVDLVEEFNEQLIEENDPKVHRAVRAATREGEPSVTVVMLPAGTDLDRQTTILQVREMLDRSAKLSHRGLFRELVEQDAYKGDSTASACLRNARLLQLDEANRVRIGPYWLTVDAELGIIIEREGGAHG